MGGLCVQYIVKATAAAAEGRTWKLSRTWVIFHLKSFPSFSRG